MASSSSSMAATPAAPTSHLSSALTGAPTSNSSVLSAAQFREIHKNTWLKRLTAEGKKITVGPKKSDRSWVVFCVHDDTEALLEGYAEPRQAASHNPEWMVSLQDTLHISHALIPNSHEFEFVVTLSNEVIRFHAMSWEIMQEWVETLRSKLREMKILSPRENLYTKLPEIRAPLLPTRDPTSPLPAPPPVPAALVPGVERVVPPSLQQETTTEVSENSTRVTTTTTTTMAAASTTPTAANSCVNTQRTNSNNTPTTTTTTTATAATIATTATVNTTATPTPTPTPTPIFSAMSNTLTQNLLNMLSDPISAYSEQLNGVITADEETRTGENFVEDTLSAEQDFNDDEFEADLLSHLLRKSCREASVSDKSIRVDIGTGNRVSADQIQNWEHLMHVERTSNARPQTSRSLSAGAADETRRSGSRKQSSKLSMQQNYIEGTLTTSSSNNITELEISSDSMIPITRTATISTPTTRSASTPTVPTVTSEADKTNITIIQVSTTNVADAGSPTPAASKPKSTTKLITADIFKFPETNTTPMAISTAAKAKQHEYKSNVQIIPSSNATNSSTIQVLGQQVGGNASANQYSTPVKKQATTTVATKVSTASTAAPDNNRITTVHVAGVAPISKTGTSTSASQAATSVSVYGTCFSALSTAQPSNGAVPGGTPKLPKKIILSANTSGVTNITVNNAHAAEVRLRNNDTINDDVEVRHNVGSVHYEKVFLSSSVPVTNASTVSSQTQWNSPKRPVGALIPITSQTATSETAALNPHPPSSPIVSAKRGQNSANTPSVATRPSKSRHISTQSTSSSSRANIVGGSPALERRRIASPTNQCTPSTSQPPLPTRPPFLTRGLTEAVITTRPSRRDFHFLKQAVTKTKTPHAVGNSNKPTAAAITTNNNDDIGNAPAPSAVSRTNSELLEQRRRSSSTSDARNNTRGANNNEFPTGRNGVAGVGSGGYAALRIQQPPQPFRSVENSVGGISSAPPISGPATNSPAKRLTLREQQVMQLRREIMHPGGVRLQLRRKDCVGSIAWVDAFGAVWVAGWKQKEHPVLYNALHIGDQLLSIAGASISTAAEANKIIRNTNTLFVEVLVRRIPFGRGYAIRREREGQCLGLIRDGNTSTIVDIVPNSLAARHGLPPKAQSCDGLTLTFWVLTEINGRPLNLFFKDNEIRDRLNSVGRDISILVQPSDLIMKLKKQLKSLRGYKDYLVQ